MDLFELLCKVLDQNLFTQVDWARNSYYFKDLKVRRNNSFSFLFLSSNPLKVAYDFGDIFMVEKSYDFGIE